LFYQDILSIGDFEKHEKKVLVTGISLHRDPVRESGTGLYQGL